MRNPKNFMYSIVSAIILASTVFFPLVNAQTPEAVWAINSDPPPQKVNVNKDDSPCDAKTEITLNMNIPFIGRCIKKDPSAKEANDQKDNPTIGNVFPKLMGWLIRLTMTLVYIIWFLCILAGGFMIAGNGALGTKEKGKKLIIAVVAGLILLWASGVILNMINPDFFGTDSGA